MDFEELLALVGDNEEAKGFVTGLQSTQKDNVTRINTLETQIGDITATRDKYKNGNKLIKDALGLENINEDSISEYLSKSKKGNPDEALTAEIGNLKSLLETATNEKETLKSEYETKLQDLGITTQLQSLGLSKIAKNDYAEELLLGKLKDGAIIEDGQILYKQDGKTLYSNTGKPLTPSEKIAELKADSKVKDVLFLHDALSGSGTQNNNGNGGKQPSDYTEAERVAMYKDNPTQFAEIFNIK